MNRRTWLVVGVVVTACSQPASEADSGVFLTVTFPEEDAGQVPLYADNLQVRTRVQMVAQGFVGLPKVNLTVNGQAGAVAGSTTVTLAPSADGSFSLLTTVTAPEPGAVTVLAELGGVAGQATTRMLTPWVAGAAELSRAWGTNSARYTICAETSASRGKMAFTSEDQAVTVSPAPVELVSGPCASPDAGGAGVAHAITSVAALVPFRVQATLSGRPAGADPGPWETSVQVGADQAPRLSLRVVDAGVVGRTPEGGTVLATQVQALVQTGPISGLPLTFTSGCPPWPASVSTSGDGMGITYLTVPDGGTCFLQVTSSAGGYVSATLAAP